MSGLTQPSKPQTGGSREPHCLYTLDGICLIERDVAWAETLGEEASQKWESASDSTKPNEVLEAGETAALIEDHSRDAWHDACNREPCANCPRRREVGG